MDRTNDGKDQRMGNQDNDTLVPFQMTEETWVDYHTRTCELARKIWMQIGLAFRA